MLSVSTPLCPVFGFTWPMSSCCSPECVCPSGLQSPSSPFAYLTFHTDVSCGHLRCSVLATWRLRVRLTLWATVTMSFVLDFCPASAFVALSLHTTCSILRSLFRDKLGASSFHSPRVITFGRHIIGRGARKIPGCLPLSPVVWNLSAIIKRRRLNLLQPISVIFL
jgi:hypothetical protein